MWDLVDDAIYKTIHEYKDGHSGGAVALAPKINTNAGTLNNKANPGMERHQLGLKESIPIQYAATDFRIAHAYCQALGGVFMRVENLAGTSDVELLNTWARLIEEEGETAAAIRRALEDGDVTSEELKEIKRETFEDIQIKLELFRRLESISRG